MGKCARYMMCVQQWEVMFARRKKHVNTGVQELSRCPYVPIPRLRKPAWENLLELWISYIPNILMLLGRAVDSASTEGQLQKGQTIMNTHALVKSKLFSWTWILTWTIFLSDINQIHPNLVTWFWHRIFQLVNHVGQSQGYNNEIHMYFDILFTQLEAAWLRFSKFN